MNKNYKNLEEEDLYKGQVIYHFNKTIKVTGGIGIITSTRPLWVQKSFIVKWLSGYTGVYAINQLINKKYFRILK